MIRFTVIISEELNKWLEEQARLNLRSKAKQVEHLLNLLKQGQEAKKQEVDQ